MKNFAELDAFEKAIIKKYPDYKTNINAAKDISNHPDYAYYREKNWGCPWVYFYVEDSPTSVLSCFVLEKGMIKYLK